MATAAPERLYFTGDDEADALIAQDPLALLIGFSLDQQVSVQKAFSSPLELKRRLGSLDAETIARTDPGTLEEIFRRKPALHRYPGSMAQRVQDLAAAIVEDYGGRAERVWTEAADGADLKSRLSALPGFGDMKVRGMLGVLAKRFGIRLEGLDDVVPTHPTLGDVDSPEARERYQEAKRAYKARTKAQQSG
ncbi:MAG: DNA repair protein [Actinobacteria bacterium]|nr:MAG: DNA repair protein [Actinomycetota bacterium]